MLKAKKYIKKVIALDEKSSSKARGHRLKRLRALAGLSRKNLCENSNININTLSGWEAGKHGGLPRDGAERVIEHLHQAGVICDLNWLLHEIGDPPRLLNYLKDENKKHAQIHKFSLQQHEREFLEQTTHEILVYRAYVPHSIDILIEDDSMFPLYQKNDWVAGPKYMGKMVNQLTGNVCIVQTENGEILVRQLRKGLEEDTFTLVCLNANATHQKAIIHNTKLICAAPICRIYRALD